MAKLGKKHRERLEMAAKELRAWKPTKKERFDMSWWGRETDCGTVCCAAGYVASQPWFNRRGLTFHPNDRDRPIHLRGLLVDDHTDLNANFQAIQSFFGLGESAADHLFMGWSYAGSRVTPVTVARRIEQFLKSS